MKPVGTLSWEFADGTIRETAAYAQLNILGHAEIFEITLPQACGGQAECATCRVEVLEGEVSHVLPDERELRRAHPRAFAKGERLGCRARPMSSLHIKLRGRSPADLRDS